MYPSPHQPSRDTAARRCSAADACAATAARRPAGTPESLPADRSREDNGAARASPHAILRKQQRRQFPPPSNRARVGRTHRLEQRQELLARSVLVPFALAAYDLEQLVHGLFARALGVERLGQRKARLEVARVRSYLRAQGGEIARLRGALFQRELCLHGAES